MAEKKLEMENGKIYFISYGGTTLIARYKETDTTEYILYDYLHYWAGYETYRGNGEQRVVKSGIEEIRTASDAEKHSLLRRSIEHNNI